MTKPFLVFLLACSLGSRTVAADYPIVPVPFSEVEMTDTFWRPRLVTQRDTLVPFALDQAKVGVDDLQGAADYLAGKGVPAGFKAQRFVTSDLFKVMEGAAYLVKIRRDPQLEARIDGIIDIIAAAQQPDGYIYPAHTTKVGTAKDEMGDRPYSYVLHSHELYNMGHLYEAAVAYYQATGKERLLKVAEKNAEHVNRVFFVGDPDYNDGKPVMQAPGHQEIELALVKLSRATGKPLYLDMARKFLEIRGVTFQPSGKGGNSPAYAQQHQPVKEQREAVGHSVRAAYLYSGMADVSALTGDEGYQPALDAIWHDIVDTKMHLTGGLGAIHGIEGFGPSFVLPNAETYNETCAAVGNVLVNLRLFLMGGDAKYLDVAEVALLNNVLAGVNLEGNRFFYVNPLETNGQRPFNHGSANRSPWFGTACCPSNLARLIPQVPGMLYAHQANDLYLTFYAGSRTQVKLADVAVGIKQETGYPNDGRVTVSLAPERTARFRLFLRIPTWTRDRFVPGELYHYVDTTAQEFTLQVNGQPVTAPLERGFAIIDREWRAGDKVELVLPMPVRFSAARPEVAADRDRVASTRGPLVLCAEGADNSGAVQRFFFDRLPDTVALRPAATAIPGKASFVSFTVPAMTVTAEGGTDPAQVTLIPYYAWSNRGDNSMIVWMPRKSELAVLDPTKLPRNSPFREVRASSTFSGGELLALSDLQPPVNSADTTIPHWESGFANIEQPEKGVPQWVEGEFHGPRNLRSVGVYWFVDGEYRKLPASWSLEVRQDGRWRPFRLYTTDEYGRRLDQYNVVHPAEPLTCDAIRINLQLDPDTYLVGIHEISVEFEPETP